MKKTNKTKTNRSVAAKTAKPAKVAKLPKKMTKAQEEKAKAELMPEVIMKAFFIKKMIKEGKVDGDQFAATIIKNKKLSVEAKELVLKMVGLEDKIEGWRG